MFKDLVLQNSDFLKRTGNITKEYQDAKSQNCADKIMKSIVDIRTFANDLEYNHLIIFVKTLHKNGIINDLVNILKANHHVDNTFVREITWIFLAVFTVDDDEIKKYLTNGILVSYELILKNSQDEEIIEHIIWGYANLVEDNNEIQNLFEDLGIFEKIRTNVIEEL